MDQKFPCYTVNSHLLDISLKKIFEQVYEDHCENSNYESGVELSDLLINEDRHNSEVIEESLEDEIDELKCEETEEEDDDEEQLLEIRENTDVDLRRFVLISRHIQACREYGKYFEFELGDLESAEAAFASKFPSLSREATALILSWKSYDSTATEEMVCEDDENPCTGCDGEIEDENVILVQQISFQTLPNQKRKFHSENFNLQIDSSKKGFLFKRHRC